MSGCSSSVLGIYALAIYLARGIRRATLRNIAFAFIVVGLIVLVVRRFVGNYVVDSLTSPEYQGTINHVWLIGSSVLGDIGRATIFYGVIGLIGALLAGPTRLATAVRGRLAPTVNQNPGTAWGTAALLFLLLVLWGPTHALKTWWGILLLAGLLALGVWALLRDMRKEFPAALCLRASPPRLNRARAEPNSGASQALVPPTERAKETRATPQARRASTARSEQHRTRPVKVTVAVMPDWPSPAPGQQQLFNALEAVAQRIDTGFDPLLRRRLTPRRGRVHARLGTGDEGRRDRRDDDRQEGDPVEHHE